MALVDECHKTFSPQIYIICLIAWIVCYRQHTSLTFSNYAGESTHWAWMPKWNKLECFYIVIFYSFVKFLQGLPFKLRGKYYQLKNMLALIVKICIIVKNVFNTMILVIIFLRNPIVHVINFFSPSMYYRKWYIL